MIRLVILFFLIACTSSAEKAEGMEINEDTIIISGSVGYPQQGVIVLEKIKDNQAIPYDTFQLDNSNQFKEEVIVEEPGYFRLNFYNKQHVVLILEDDDITVNVDGNNRNGFVSISGSDAHELINKVQSAQQNLQRGPEVAQLNEEFSEAVNNNDTEQQDALRKKYLKMESDLNDQLMAMMDSAGNSLAVVDLLSSGRILDKDRYFEYYDKKAKQFREALPSNDRVIAFNDQVEKMRITAIGQIAPEIALPNPDGDTVKLSSLRGKYVLVDFWAKWCGPCRKENPNVVRAYNKFKNKGFEVFGVSLDRNRADWLQAIEEDKLYWTQVSDLKYWNSEAAKTYGINAIPFALLLDPEGRIIAKNLRGQELDDKLEEIFGKE